MQRAKCDIRSALDADRSMLLLLAEETLHPLATGAGHPERYRASEFLDLLDRADVFVGEIEDEIAGFMAVESEETGLALRCLCVSPGFEDSDVADRLLEWAEGMAVNRKLDRLVAHVPTADRQSLELYRGHGFLASEDDRRPELFSVVKRLPVVEP